MMRFSLSIIILSFVAVLMGAGHARGSDKVIFGEDDRIDTWRAEGSLLASMAKSTAAMIKPERLVSEGQRYKVNFEEAKTLQQKYNVCSEERFLDQWSVASCTGFLVAPDLLVTAGHCMTETTCKERYWVFDFQLDRGGKMPESFAAAKVYRCAEIVALDYNPPHFPRHDYALIRLDRYVEDRPFLSFRKDGRVEEGDKFGIIGHPLGLPQKVAPGGELRYNDEDFFFETTLDTFGGNSGSPVVNLRSGLVEGIHVRAEGDKWVTDEARNCQKPRRCQIDEEECTGSQVERIEHIAPLFNGYLPAKKLIYALSRSRFFWAYEILQSQKPDLKTVGPVGENMLHLAFLKDNQELVEFFMQRGLSPLEKDNEGRCSLHYSARGGSLWGVKLLLENEKVPVDVEDHAGRTALMAAVEEGSREVVSYLARRCADPFKSDNLGHSAYSLALEQGRNDLVRAMVRGYGDCFF